MRSLIYQDFSLPRGGNDGVQLSHTVKFLWAYVSLELEEYSSTGNVHNRRMVLIAYQKTRAGWNAAWSLARKLIRATRGNPALITAAELRHVNILESEPFIKAETVSFSQP